MSNVNFDAIAKECGLGREEVRKILTESMEAHVSREVQDLVFKTARRLGYNFRKLKIGKRMTVVLETLCGLIEQIERNRSWGRTKILRHLRENVALIERVQKRTFLDEYGQLNHHRDSASHDGPQP